MITINKIARAGILGGLLMGAVALKATNPITNVSKTPNQTEVVSKEGAAALKAASLQGVQQASVSTTHNQRLNSTLRKFAENNNDQKQINAFINNIYTEKGTFWASAQIQHELDRQMLFLLLDEKGDLLIKNNINSELGKEIKAFGSDFYKSVRSNANSVGDWLENNYSKKISGLLYFDHKPTAEEMIKRLDEIAEKKANFTKEDITYYYLASDNFKRKKINGKTDDLSKSELISKKIFTIDKIIFKKTLNNNNFFGKDSQFAKHANLEGYYEDWMNTVEPQGK